MSRDETAWEPAHLARAPLVGREAALEALRGALASVKERGETRIATVIGAPGIGKSRLVQELLRARPGAGPEVRVHRGSARESGAAYGIFGRMLRARFGVAEGADADAIRARIRAEAAKVMGDRKVGDVLYFLGQLMGLSFDESPLTRAVEDDPGKADLIRRAVLKAFLEADAATGPICLVFEDLHAAHDDALALLRYLLEYLSGPILVLCMARHELLARHEEWAKVGEPRHALLELAPLRAAEAAALMEALLAPCVEGPAESRPAPLSSEGPASAVEAPPRQALVDAACAFAGGNPELLERMVRIYLDKGVLEETAAQGSPPRWLVHPARLSAAQLPLTVEDATNLRLAALDATERLLLEQAAVIGSVFWVGALVVLARAGGEVPALWGEGGDDDARIEVTLGSLVERGYLSRLPGSGFAGSQAYAFRHGEEREALLLRTSPAARRRYRLSIADWLEQQEAARSSEELLTMLAGHRERAGDAGGAGLAYLDAGDVARSRYANARAAEHYEKGLDLLGDSHVVRRIDALHHHGDVLHLAGRIEEALASFREMLTLAYRMDNRRKGGAAHNRIGRLHRDLGALDEAGQHLETALRLFGEAGDERGVASTIDDIGKLHWVKGEYQVALRWLRDGLARRERMGDRRSIALSLNNLGLALQDSGEFKQALGAFEGSLVIRREISDLWGVVASLNNLGTIAQDQRDFGRALAFFQEALDVAQQIGDRNRIALVLTNIGETLYRSGDPDAAVRVLGQAEEKCDELGDKLLLAEVLRGLGKAHLLRGDLQRARDAINRAVDLFASIRSKVHLGVALRTLGEITAAGGWGSTHTKSARAYFDRSVGIFEETGNEVELARTLKTYARYLTTERAFAANRAARREAAKMVQRADAIFLRLQGSLVAFRDEPTAPGLSSLASSAPPLQAAPGRGSPEPSVD